MKNFIVLFLLFIHCIYGQNLIVQVNHRYLDRCFQGFAEWVTYYMQGNLIHGRFHQKYRTGAIQATNIQTTNLTLKSTSPFHHHGEHYVQIKGFNLKLKGDWHYKLLFILSDSGSFSLDIDDMNVTIGPIHPEVFSGLPFINADVDCSMHYGSFGFSLNQPKRFSELLSRFIHRLIRSKIERTICDEITRAFDSFLRHGVEQLFLRHSLAVGAVLNNSLTSKPLISVEGDITTYHYGIVSGDSAPVNEITLLHQYTFDVTYLLRPQLLDEVLSAIHQKLLFNEEFHDDQQNKMITECVRPPQVTIEGEGVIAVIEQQFIAENRSVVFFNETFTIGLLLRILYSHRSQLFFQVIRSSNLGFLPEILRQQFGVQLRRRWSEVISTYLRAPLPSAVGVLVRNASLAIEKPFIVFGVNIEQKASSSPSTTPSQ